MAKSINPTKSSGTFGRGHFNQSRAATSLFEPVYLNMFTVLIDLPSGIGEGYAPGQEGTNLLLEGITKIGGLQSHTYPTGTATQNYKWAQRRFVGAKPEKTTMDVTIDFEVNLDDNNSPYVLKTLRKWCDLAYDPLTGRTGVKKDYTADWVLITMYSRDGKPFWQWKLYYVFPISQLTIPELEYTTDSLYKITGFTLACDSFDESII
jgi:hypothetical protein